MTYSVTASSEGGCCGHRELFDFEDDNSAWKDIYVEDSSEDNMIGETFKDLFTEIQKYNKGIVYSIWFYKPKKWDGSFGKSWHWQKLRTLVRAIPNVVHLGTTINPNSGNKIDGYSWINK